MSKTILGVAVIIALIAFTYFGVTGQFSLTQEREDVTNGELIEIDSGIKCTIFEDCIDKFDKFPEDGYCKGGTCRSLMPSAIGGE